MNFIIKYSYELVRSKRKTISISVTKELKVKVRAPLFLNKNDIEYFLLKHQNWIEKSICKIKKTQEIKQLFCFSDNQIIYFLGQKYLIETIKTNVAVSLDNGRIILSDKIKNRQSAVIKFLKNNADEYVKQRTAYFSGVMGVNPAGIKITSAKTRWGSCSAKNSICFSYRIICLEPEIIDYIVVHELAHIKQHNHSKKFYNEIFMVMPDYKQRISKLKAFQKNMMI